MNLQHLKNQTEILRLKIEDCAVVRNITVRQQQRLLIAVDKLDAAQKCIEEAIEAGGFIEKKDVEETGVEAKGPRE